METRKLSGMTMEGRNATLAAARKQGAQAGTFDVRQVSAEGIDNLRAWLENPPGPLSGEWADQLTPQALADEFGVEDDTDTGELSEAYEDGYWNAANAWVEQHYPSIDVG